MERHKKNITIWYTYFMLLMPGLYVCGVCLAHPMIQDQTGEENQQDEVHLLGAFLGEPPVPSVPIPETPFKYIFLSDITYAGSLDQLPGGPSEANRLDAVCNSASNRPRPESNYLALISTGPGDRLACTTANCSGGSAEHFDWVLQPDMQYRRPDGAILVSTLTDIGLFDMSSGLQNSLASTYSAYWTGLNSDWTYGGAAANCNGWNSNLLGTGIAGFSDRVDSGAYAGGAQPCGATLRIACVEQ